MRRRPSKDDLIWASPAGDTALFISCDKLTDASAPSKSCASGATLSFAGQGTKLYRWDRDADADIYRWSEAEGWTCISCQLPGAPSGGDATGFRPLHAVSTFSEMASIEADITMSEDGKRIFFTTEDARAPGHKRRSRLSCDPRRRRRRQRTTPLLHRRL